MKPEQIRLTPTIRVENGPARKVATATADMWPDLDAKGRANVDAQVRNALLPDGIKLMKHYKLGFKDALGKVIKEGEPFTYLDRFGTWVWYVYQLEDVELGEEMLGRMAVALKVKLEEITAEMIATWYGVATAWVTPAPWRLKRFMPKGEYAERDGALAAAAALKE